MSSFLLLKSHLTFKSFSTMEEGKDDTKEIEDIRIEVQDQNEGAIMNFKMKRSTPFRRLMNAYSTRLKINLESLCFTFNGNSLPPTNCPNDHQMKDGDIIVATNKLVEKCKNL